MRSSKRKIAVCFSGQPRQWRVGLPSIFRYYKSDENEYRFFGHAWDENSWKTIICSERDTIHERIDKDKLEKDLRAALPFEYLLVENQLKPSGDDWKTWIPMLRSAAISNHLKTKYEIENDMTFDVVVKTRWDVVYNPYHRLDFFVNSFFNPNVLYCNLMYDFHKEFRLPAIDDVMYFGSSRVMNLLSNMYLPYVNSGVEKRWGDDHNNLTHLFVGCGVLLYKWATLHNIGFHEPTNFVTPVVLRKTLEDLRWPDDYEAMRQKFMSFEAV